MAHSPSDRSWSTGRDVTGIAVAAVLASLVAGASLRIWDWRPGIPLSIVGDSPLVLTQLDDILTNGWFWSNDAIGFPLGQNASFFPELDVIHVLAVKVLGLFSHDPATVGAIYFFLGYPLVAMTTYLLARSEHLSRAAAVVIGVLFAAAPYHAERFEHLWLASYWTVPVALWLILSVARGLTPFEPGAARSRWHLLVTTSGLIAVGFSGAYYAGFTVLLLVAVLVLRSGPARARGWWRGGLISIGVLAASAAVPLVAARIGMSGTSMTGPRPATRNPLESERYAGRIIDLILPWEGHRLDALASLTQAYQAAGRPVVETVALGIVGLVGAISLLIVGLRALAIRKLASPRLMLWAALLVLSGLFYTAGGLGSVVALVATPQLRTWSRMSVFILLLGLLAVGHWLTKPRTKVLAVGLPAVVLVVGVLDQTNSNRAPDYVAIHDRLDGIRTYTAALSAATEPGCGVLQLPIMRFPEGELPAGYDINAQLLQHLTTKDLRWSHGGMSGTQAGDWPLGLDLDNPGQLQRELRAAGFCAVEVDTSAMTAKSPVVASLSRHLGNPVATGSDGRLLAWSLRGVGQGDAADRTRLLEPLLVGLASGRIVVDGTDVYQDSGPRTAMTTSNLSNSTVVPVTVSVDVTSLGAPQREVVIRDGDTVVARSTVTADVPTPVTFQFAAPPGYRRLQVTVSGDPVRDDHDRSVSARFANLSVRSDLPTHVVSLQAQARSGLVFP